MKKIKYVILLLLIILNTGCWNYKELNQIAIVSALGFDIEEDEYVVSLQVLSNQKIGSGNSGELEGQSPVILYIGKGKSVRDAITEAMLSIPREIYLGHIEIAIIGEELARKGIMPIVDFLLRYRKIRKIYPMLVADNDTALNILKILTRLETIPSNNIKELLEKVADEKSTVSNRTFDEVLECLYVPGREATMSSIQKIVYDDEEKGETTENVESLLPNVQLKSGGAAIFFEDKLRGFLDTDTSVGYNFIRNHVDNAHISFPCDDEDNYGTAFITKAKREFKIEFIDDKPLFNINIKTDAVISEITCEIEVEKPKNIKVIEKAINKRIKEVIEEIMSILQNDFKSDPTGFGEQLYRNHYKYWKKHEKNWENIFLTVDYKVKVETKINNVGAISTHSRKRDEDEQLRK